MKLFYLIPAFFSLCISLTADQNSKKDNNQFSSQDHAILLESSITEEAIKYIINNHKELRYVKFYDKNNKSASRWLVINKKNIYTNLILDKQLQKIIGLAAMRELTDLYYTHNIEFQKPDFNKQNNKPKIAKRDIYKTPVEQWTAEEWNQHNKNMGMDPKIAAQLFPGDPTEKIMQEFRGELLKNKSKEEAIANLKDIINNKSNIGNQDDSNNQIIIVKKRFDTPFGYKTRTEYECIVDNVKSIVEYKNKNLSITEIYDGNNTSPAIRSVYNEDIESLSKTVIFYLNDQLPVPDGQLLFLKTAHNYNDKKKIIILLAKMINFTNIREMIPDHDTAIADIILTKNGQLYIYKKNNLYYMKHFKYTIVSNILTSLKGDIALYSQQIVDTQGNILDYNAVNSG